MLLNYRQDVDKKQIDMCKGYTSTVKMFPL